MVNRYLSPRYSSGEISVLRGGLPTATVVGDGAFCALRGRVLRQLDINPVFRESVEELVKMRLARDRLRLNGCHLDKSARILFTLFRRIFPG